MAEHLDDKELLFRFKQDATKEAAYTAIIKKYQEKLYWHIRRMVVDHEDANDVLQNMFIKVWRSLDNFRYAASIILEKTANSIPGSIE